MEKAELIESKMDIIAKSLNAIVSIVDEFDFVEVRIDWKKRMEIALYPGTIEKIADATHRNIQIEIKPYYNYYERYIIYNDVKMYELGSVVA